MFMKGSPPFEKADIINDPYYKTMMLKPDTYWNVLDKNNEMSLDFRKMIQNCLKYESEKRFSIRDLKNCSFMKKEIKVQEALDDIK